MNMGLLHNLEWMNAYGKKRCRSMFWRMRAAVKKALKKNVGKKQLKFQYDPSSYALNFDDGCCHLRDKAKIFKEDANIHELIDMSNTTWVYVIWIKTK